MDFQPKFNSPRDAVVHRSGGRCEAMVPIGTVWARCGRGPIEVHHALKRSRGGHLLDAFTDYHLIAVCHKHHREAEEENDWEAGLILPGYVITDSTTGRPVYTGSDEFLTKEFG